MNEDLLRSAFAFAVVALALSTSAAASADVPGPRPVCDAEGLACETCWQSYSDTADDKTRFDECAAPLKAKGYSEGCRHRQGAGDSVFFCAAGAKPEVVTRGGGCGGCALPARDEPLGSGLALAALALTCWSVRRARSRPSR